MLQLKEGVKAPQFKGIDQNGKEVKLTDFTGKKVILYFYPKDNTPGCTAEACNLRDNYGDILKKGFGMNVVAYDPFPNLDYAKEAGIEYVDLPTLYSKSDIIDL